MNFEMLKELKARDIDFQRADVKWIDDMHNAFFNLSEYIEKRKTSVNKFDLNKLIEYQEFVSNRRSTRKWAELNLSKNELTKS